MVDSQFKPENDSRLKGLSLDSSIELLEVSIIPALHQESESLKNLKLQAFQAIGLVVVYFSVILAGFAIIISFKSWLSYGLVGLVIAVVIFFAYKLFTDVLNPQKQKDLDDRILAYEEYLRKTLIQRDKQSVKRGSPARKVNAPSMRGRRI